MKFDRICVVGLGYVGLPTAAVIASHKKQVIGLDTNKQVILSINQKKSHITEPGLDTMIHHVVENGYLRAVLKAQSADVFLITVPTPLKKNKKPNLSFIASAVLTIAPMLKPGNLVILESTSPVGTTEKISESLAQARMDLTFPHTYGEKSDIRIAYCPERIMPGRVLEELISNDRIIGGMSKKCCVYASAFYKIFVKGKCSITDVKTAEMCKLVENCFRDVNIAFANELSLICDKAGIDVLELIRLANHHPRVNILQPGCGVGGHCIAVDPWFIISDHPQEANLIQQARLVNTTKTEWVIEKILKEAKELNKNKSNIKIALLGMTYKPDIDDIRESPSIDIAKKVGMRFSQVLIVEPHIEKLPRELDHLKKVELDTALAIADLIIILTPHTLFNTVKQKTPPSKRILSFT